MLPSVDLIRRDDADYLLLANADVIGQHIRVAGEWGRLERLVAQIFCSDLTAPLILDVGANLGAFTVPVAKSVAPRQVVVFAFEPQRVVFQQLCANVFLNRLDNVHTHQLAIGSEPGTASVKQLDYHKSINAGGLSLDERWYEFWQERQPGTVVAAAGVQPEAVEVRPLDDMTLPSPVDFLKIDVEGGELSVLEGATGLLERSQYPPIFFEVWPGDWFAEERGKIFALLEDLGYLLTIFEMDALAQHISHPRRIKFERDGERLQIAVVRNT